MRKTSHWLPAILMGLVLAQCRTARPLTTPPTAQVLTEGFITCFEPGFADGKLWCETSAVLAQGDRLYLANDKDMPAPRSSVFYMAGLSPKAAQPLSKPVYLEQPRLRMAHKFEEFAQNPARTWTFLTTAFDRIKPGSTAFDGYNMLLAWQPSQEGAAQIVGAMAGDSTSLQLRRQIQQALGGSPYFKIEGLAATDKELWFGVREQGDRYDKFDYRITLLKAPYQIRKGPKGDEQVVLGTPVLVRNFDVGDVDVALPKPLAISSIEYDPVRRSFWILTSFEQGDKIGAYLWVIGEKAIADDKQNLQLIRTADRKALTFTHKAEDMTFTDPNTLLIIHDDDRVRTRVGNRERQPNQAAYSIIRINTK